MMNCEKVRSIEGIARDLQIDTYKYFKRKGPIRDHPLMLLRPELAAEVVGLDYISLPEIPSDQFGWEVAGLLDLPDQRMYIADKFDYKTKRFTAAHEFGHALLHPHLANGMQHRDRPIFEMTTQRRSPMEQEADMFAAAFLAPARMVIEEFEKRFGPTPMRLTEKVAFQLGGRSVSDFYIETSGGLRLPTAFATRKHWEGRTFHSLVDHFQLSPSAMAIRLRELKLIND